MSRYSVKSQTRRRYNKLVYISKAKENIYDNEVKSLLLPFSIHVTYVGVCWCWYRSERYHWVESVRTGCWWKGCKVIHRIIIIIRTFIIIIFYILHVAWIYAIVQVLFRVFFTVISCKTISKHAEATHFRCLQKVRLMTMPLLFWIVPTQLIEALWLDMPKLPSLRNLTTMKFRYNLLHLLNVHVRGLFAVCVCASVFVCFSCVCYIVY